MVSPHETSGGKSRSPYSGEVAVRNLQLADYYHDRGAFRFRSKLEELTAPYPDLLDPNALEAAMRFEGQKARDKAMQDRETGYMNDRQSTELGIYVTGLVDYLAVDDIKYWLDTHSVDYDLDLTEGVGGLHYAIHFPGGAFKHIGTEAERGNEYYLSIFGLAEISQEESGEILIAGLVSANLLSGGYGIGGRRRYYGVAGRVEGAGGTLWQNPRTRPDGSFR